MPEDKIRRLKEYYETATSFDGIPEKVRKHLERVAAMGGGQGIEFISNFNKDYLGAFMAPFSRDVENADIVIVGQPLEKIGPHECLAQIWPQGAAGKYRRTSWAPRNLGSMAISTCLSMKRALSIMARLIPSGSST